MTYNFQYGKKFDVTADTSILTAKNGMTIDVGSTALTLTGALNETGNQSITGNLAVTGNITGTGNITRTGNLVLTGDLTQTGGATGISGASYVVGGSGLEFTPSQTSQTFTNAAGSARTDVGTGITIYLFKRGVGAGKLVDFSIELGNLATPANAVAAAAMTFTETIPSTYRPTATQTGILGVRDNGAEGTGSWEISTAGVVRFFGALNQANFTNAAQCALRSSVSGSYRSFS